MPKNPQSISFLIDGEEGSETGVVTWWYCGLDLNVELTSGEIKTYENAVVVKNL